MYADDSKLIGVIENEEDAFEIQKDIDSMQNWAKTWQMSFNYDKCKVMHFGKKNKENMYTMELGLGEQPHIIEKSLESAVWNPHPVWNPYLKGDIEELENIQHRVTRLVPGLKKVDYMERLRKLRLTTLETRRKRGDLIQFYKIVYGLDHIKWKKDPEKIVQGDNNGPAARNLRKGGICFRREPANICTPRNEFFLNRVIPF